MKNFALIGAAGYIAPRHLKAIKETGNKLTAAVDKHDCVGIMDSFFPKAAFFTEFERFDRHLEKEKRENHQADYISICTPNYMHDAHIRFALRYGADAICEKPLVLNPWNVDHLLELQKESGKKVYNILQLRLHPSVIALKQKIEAEPNKIHDIDLTYITSRGNWYYASWKGDINKSGGIATNIGIHFFDMLMWIFGPVQKRKIHLHEHDRASGFLELKNARVRWFLSINAETLPEKVKKSGLSTYRSLTIEGEEFEFSKGFNDLHTRSYENIMSGNGFELSEAKPSINEVFEIRQAETQPLKDDYHPLAKLPLAHHPFTKS
ncbi:Gfo/Idh/MocA family oxidoreductase [Hyphobacterium sp. CCMP332]|nr:Gfo/Idh/MocA family oxidoreductase [Hyphobacterium sp. CCMP332]